MIKETIILNTRKRFTKKTGEHHDIKISNRFLWGASISAHQTEGAYLADGKGLSVQDTRPRDNNEIADFTVAVDHYHRYKEDIALLAELGIKVFAFQLHGHGSTLRAGSVNQKGLDHYSAVIDELLKQGIQPFITLNHFDLPQALEDQGGWTNRSTVEAFETYAKTLFNAYGDRVTHWLTINEPNIMLLVDRKILGKTIPLPEKYQQFHHLMIAEKLAFKHCHELVPNGKIGPVPNISLVYAATSKPEDNQAALYFNSVRNWAYLDFACLGRYNTVFQDYLNQSGVKITIHPEDQALMTSAFPDFVAMNFYTTVTVEQPTMEGDMTNGISDQQSEDIMERGFYKGFTNPYLKKNAFNWTIDPLGLKRLCKHSMIATIYQSSSQKTVWEQKIIWKNGAVHDSYRIDYLQQHIQQCLAAIESGVELIGYSPWSAIDLISVHEGIKSAMVLFMWIGMMPMKRAKACEKDSFTGIKS